MKILRTTLLLVCSVGSPAVLAEVYAGFGLGHGSSNAQSRNEDKSGFTPITLYSTGNDDVNIGRQIHAGYTAKGLGGEFGYFDLGDYGFNGVNGYGGGSQNNIKGTAWALSATGKLPLGKVFYLHGKLGLAWVTSAFHCRSGCTGLQDGSKSAIAPLLGLGVGFDIGQHWGVRINADHFRGARTSIQTSNGTFTRSVNYTLYSAGAMYRF